MWLHSWVQCGQLKTMIACNRTDQADSLGFMLGLTLNPDVPCFASSHVCASHPAHFATLEHGLVMLELHV